MEEGLLDKPYAWKVPQDYQPVVEELKSRGVEVHLRTTESMRLECISEGIR